MTKKAEQDSAWRRFPALEKLGDTRHFEAVMSRIEGTCRALDETRSGGTPAERDRAKLALAAYGRTLELIEEIRTQAGTATPVGARR